MTDEGSSPQDFNSYIQKNIRTLAEGIKTSSVLPVGSARNNFNTCFPTFTSKLKPYSNGVLDMISTLLAREGIKQRVETCDNEEKVDLVIDGVNKILDRVRENLSTLNKSQSTAVSGEASTSKENTGVGSWNKDQNRPTAWKANHVDNVQKPIRIQRVLEKPQLRFETSVDNTNSPFEPSLSSKPNAIKPLSIYLERGVDGVDSYCHPYIHELNAFKVPENQLVKVEPVEPTDILSSEVICVDSEESLANMVAELKGVQELAIDVEYHQYRSFHGFTCLLQVSSRIKDYIIDTIVLRSKLQVLNEFFTDPKIVKVLHGAASDVIWLQKDLNLYLVNMFDTHLASTVLNFPKLNLAYLLKRYCNVDADKRYQLYDWRIRPLPKEALLYARCDTHYLLYIYDKLRNELIDEASGMDNLLLSVYSRSCELCKKRYEKTFKEDGHLELYKHCKQTFDGRQMLALKSLYQWRDEIARQQDESTGYVLPNHMLIQIAQMLPREMQGILACCNPVPVLVRQNIFQLHQLIALARSQPVNDVSHRRNVELMTASKRPSLSKLKCPHDFSYQDDFRDNLATLFAGSDSIKLDNELPKLKLSVFDKDNKKTFCEVVAENSSPVTLKSVHFISPYERYKRTLKFELAQAEKESRTAQDLNEVHQPKEEILELEENVHIFTPRSDLKQKDSVISDPKKRENITSTSPSANVLPKSVSPSTSKSPESCNRKRKQKTVLDQIPNKKYAKYDEIIPATVPKPPQTVEADSNFLQNDEETVTVVHSSPKPKAKKGKKNADKKTIDSGSVASTANGGGFKPFDYAKMNYDKFMTAGQKNLKTLLSSKITFGSKKKNKKKNQNPQRKK